jgi:hypothetical protein
MTIRSATGVSWGICSGNDSTHLSQSTNQINERITALLRTCRALLRWRDARVGAVTDRLTRAVAAHTELSDLLEEALVFAHRAVEEHEVLQKILETEPERLLPLLTTESDRILVRVKRFLALAMQRADLEPGVDLEAATDHLARMVLSLISAQGSADLADRNDVRRVVDRLLAGVVRR